MREKHRCPYCGSESVIRMDGSGTLARFGGDVMVDIAPETVHCSACKQDFKVPLLDGWAVDTEQEFGRGSQNVKSTHKEDADGNEGI